MGRGTPMRPDTAAPRARPSVVTAFLALIVLYTRSQPAAGASNTAVGLRRSRRNIFRGHGASQCGAVKRRGIGARAATESVARWWDKSNAMASVQAIKNAFVEDDDVVIPMDSGPAKRAKKDGGENGVGADDRGGASTKEWWEVDEEEEEYVPLRKRRDQGVNAAAARMGQKLRAPTGAGDGDERAGSPGIQDAAGPSSSKADEPAAAASNIREFAPPKEKTSLL